MMLLGAIKLISHLSPYRSVAFFRGAQWAYEHLLAHILHRLRALNTLVYRPTRLCVSADKRVEQW